MNRCYLGNAFWQLSSFPEYYRFRSDLGRYREVQEEVLKSITGHLSRTLYGRRHGLDGPIDYREFRRTLPIVDYESVVDYLSVPSGLFNQRVLVWEPTGGSTGGSKWIPWTPRLRSEFRRAISAWIFDLFHRYPELKSGRALWQLTPKTQVEPPAWLSGQATGFQSDGDYLGWLGRLVERQVTVSAEPGGDFWEGIVRALVGAPDLRMLSCWSPSYLQVLKTRAEETLGCWAPARWWPRLRLISCWTAGPSAVFRSTLSELFPGVEVQGKGLLSTEAVTTIPFQNRTPVAYRSHFFEFRHGSGEIVPGWELREGEEYEVIQTTSGGLTRYDSWDVVRVTGFLDTVPCLEFVGRTGVSDHFGEKLNHKFLQDRFATLGRFAALGFEEGGYVLFLEESTGNRECLGKVSAWLDSVYTYRDCRSLGQLAPLRCYLLKGGGWESLARLWGDDFAKRKVSAILPTGEWSRGLEGRFVSEDEL